MELLLCNRIALAPWVVLFCLSEACDGPTSLDGSEDSGDYNEDNDSSDLPVFNDDIAEDTPSSHPYDELTELGLDRYLGSNFRSVQSVDNNITQFEWPINDDGPLCLARTPYRMAFRDMGSENLLIFLGGGGFCYSKMCSAQKEAETGMVTNGILNPDEPENPLADWNAAYLPACDGSLFVGDIDAQNGPQRGLRNLSASLSAIKAKMPHPQRIVLAGTSAGGYGTIPATALTRITFPDPEILVLNDSGVGLGRPNEPEFLATIMDEFSLSPYLEAACSAIECTKNEHVTWLMDYALAEDEKVRFGLISSYNDLVIGTVFLQRPFVFKGALVEEVTGLAERNPERTAYFLYRGIDHTVLGRKQFYSRTADGTQLRDWLVAALNTPESWSNARD